MQKRAIIDIDNTLWHFCDALHEELRKINANFPAPDNWTDWDMWRGYCSADEFMGAVNAIHFGQDSDRYLPYPEAENFLSALRENGYHITIASHRSPDCRIQTGKWLDRYGLQYDELHLSFEKTVLFDTSPDVVVDDAPPVLEKAMQKGVAATGLLFPWNRACAGNGFRLFESLNEILGYILRKHK
jgi:hypothetical protein